MLDVIRSLAAIAGRVLAFAAGATQVPKRTMQASYKICYRYSITDLLTTTGREKNDIISRTRRIIAAMSGINA